ncbi:hypothetical protein [uncultured Aquimarina sp.]|uniref:hypothetical protein n=1 Tax=uncultured Aquimarina sp. TaxID=575652 RepID=UPI0026315CA0|nr:hypothetical protein [uncultured Aquimarina sp.]
MEILDLRILPPIAIGRLGSSEIPMDAYTLSVSDEAPLDFRTIIPEDSLSIDPETGVINTCLPNKIIFKDSNNVSDKNGVVRPVAPFLEVFAITSDNKEVLVPLTLDLLEQAGHSLSDISWHIDIANIKLYRRTQNNKDKINAELCDITSHERIPLEGYCDNFIPGKVLPLGHIQFVQPTAEFPQIRLRWTPGPGKVYGSSKERINENTLQPEPDPLYKKYGDDFLIYDETKDWHGYEEGNQKRPILTNPAQIFAGYNNKEGLRVSWGYLDDECDGFASVHLKKNEKETLKARAHISAGPPAYAPDTLPVRVVTDELEQILLGPDIDKEVPIEEAEEIIRRALETVRIMNTAIMNGNPYNGKARIASTMSAQDSNDFGRMFEPIMATSIVDNLAVQAIHDRVFNGISTGMAPWFENALRRPDKIGDLSNEERRKMPAMMRGADGRALCFTHRQINTIIKSAASAMFQEADKRLNHTATTSMLVKDVVSQLHYKALGNPFSVLPRTAISNCFPGLEFDFRNLWRRAFKGLLLLENNNFVLSGEGDLDKLKYHRLVGLHYGDTKHPTTVITTGPTFPNSGNNTLINTSNPNGVSFMEWSNNLAEVLQLQGQKVIGYFTKKESNEEVVFTADQLHKDNDALITKELTVNHFFNQESAAFSNDILEPGELTQGLCAPWQNDYRECACYYWAASRPDYVNIEPGADGLSKGDNWMSKKRSGAYIPDDRTDSRLVTYDDLFENWEGELSFIVKGRDALDSDGDKSDLLV